MNSWWRYIVMGVLLVLFGARGGAMVLTERYNVSYLDLKNGLPHNNVSSIFVDSGGFLWVGTYGGGLVRYDGYGMMTPVMWLNSNSCKSIAEDRYKHLWVAFDEGTNIFDLRTMSGVIPKTLNDDLRRLLSEPSTKTYCDAMGRIWIVTYSTVNMLTFDEQGHVAKSIHTRIMEIPRMSAFAMWKAMADRGLVLTVDSSEWWRRTVHWCARRSLPSSVF